MATSSITSLMIWRSRAVAGSSRFTAFLATRRARVIIIVLFVIGIAWLTYRHVGQPLRTEIPLPPGVSESNPELNEELLKTINAQRVERVEQKLPPFSVGTLFQPTVRQ